MRYAIFTDIHANLEALEAVLAKIDEIAKKEPIDQIWFLGDLVGYGPNPNECISTLRARTDVIIAGNHDWAAVGKIDLEDFSPAARISAEWTTQQLTEEYSTFLANLPERLDIGDCTLVHGSPYGPLWEYLTSDVLAERSFQYFSTRYCFVGHTHVPVIFQQPDTIANAPTQTLIDVGQNVLPTPLSNGVEHSHVNEDGEENQETEQLVTVHFLTPTLAIQNQMTTAAHAESAYADPHTGQTISEAKANVVMENQLPSASSVDTLVTIEALETSEADVPELEGQGEEKATDEEQSSLTEIDDTIQIPEAEGEIVASPDKEDEAEKNLQVEAALPVPDIELVEIAGTTGTGEAGETEEEEVEERSDSLDFERTTDGGGMVETVIVRLDSASNSDTDSEIAELMDLLGLTQSMIQVTNEMLAPPEGPWQATEGCRAIINPGGVGQPRDGDPRAAFMIYDTKRGFEFYRVPYAIEKTQEKIIQAGLPQYLAMRLAYGR